LLLGMIVETVTHDSVGDQLRKRLLLPYGLTQTSYPDSQGCRSRGSGFGLTQQRTWEDVSGTVPVSLMGSAGLVISDMADINTQNEKPVPGVANAVFRGIAKIMTPNNVPFVSSGSKGRSGL
jgi:CubicO group peptidase (beta-lactamase class C family)